MLTQELASGGPSLYYVEEVSGGGHPGLGVDLSSSTDKGMKGGGLKIMAFPQAKTGADFQQAI